MPPKITHIDPDYVAQQYNDGRSMADIADEHLVSVSTIVRILREQGVKRRDGSFQPSKIDTNEIVELYKSGLSQGRLAKRYSVAENVISRILRMAGIEKRSAQEAAKLRWADIPHAERVRLTAGQLRAARMAGYSEERLVKIAATREQRQTQVTEYDSMIAKLLIDRGYLPICHKAFGRYNCSIGLDNVAVDFYRGDRRLFGRQLQANIRRVDYLLNRGCHVIIIDIGRRSEPPNNLVADYIRSFIRETHDQHEPLIRMVRPNQAGDFAEFDLPSQMDALAPMLIKVARG